MDELELSVVQPILGLGMVKDKTVHAPAPARCGEDRSLTEFTCASLQSSLSFNLVQVHSFNWFLAFFTFSHIFSLYLIQVTLFFV